MSTFQQGYKEMQRSWLVAGFAVCTQLKMVEAGCNAYLLTSEQFPGSHICLTYQTDNLLIINLDLGVKLPGSPCDHEQSI